MITWVIIVLIVTMFGVAAISIYRAGKRAERYAAAENALKASTEARKRDEEVRDLTDPAIADRLKQFQRD